VVHPKVFTDPMLRERYGIKSSKRGNLWFAVGLIIIALLWFIWSGTNIANPKLRSELISFKVIDDQSISISYSIKVRDLDIAHSCKLVARDLAKTVVGEVNDAIGAGELLPGKNLRTVVITTRTPAVNAGISSCQ
jgi:hypothetical protein